MTSKELNYIPEIEFDILNCACKNIGKDKICGFISEKHAVSIENANSLINGLLQKGLISADMELSQSGREILEPYRVKNAVIMAAGMSTRFAPLSYEKPKALLKVKGELLIEREIRQLKEAGISEIIAVVGYMKEKLFYLADKYNVKIMVNEDYYRYNNTSTLMLAADALSNTYICSSDNYFTENPFEQYVYRSYYSAVYAEGKTGEYCIAYDNNDKITQVAVGGRDSWYMIGHVYFDRSFSEKFVSILKKEYADPDVKQQLWEDVYISHIGGLDMYIRKYPYGYVMEFDTLEELRRFDKNYLKDSDSEILKNICSIFECEEDEIVDITVLKKGMTNRSFLFSCKGNRYIMRVPGEGTDKLISRRQEAQVYKIIENKGLCDNAIYLNPENGFKITKFIDGARVCNPDDDADLNKCMNKLREFHNMKLAAEHEFDLFGQIDFYESLWNGKPSIYEDYQETKHNIFLLKDYIGSHAFPYCLTHIDAVPDNFLIYTDDGGEEKIQLTDWEYAGMQDPHIDIAMFCIYSMYGRNQADRLIDIYFENNCPEDVRTKIYCYIAACGLLWSNWCEYKRSMGVEFGEYAARQYLYAKEYYKIARRRL